MSLQSGGGPSARLSWEEVLGAVNGRDLVQLSALECRGLGVACNPQIRKQSHKQARFGSVPNLWFCFEPRVERRLIRSAYASGVLNPVLVTREALNQTVVDNLYKLPP